jgi:hypothetical protein
MHGIAEGFAAANQGPSRHPSQQTHDVDHGLVVVGLGLIVAYAAAMLADPGERSLYHPPAGQDDEAWLGAFDDVDSQEHDVAGPDQRPSGVSGIGPDQAMVVKRSRSRASSPWAASRSCSPAIVTITANSRPPVSTAM